MPSPVEAELVCMGSDAITFLQISRKAEWMVSCLQQRAKGRLLNAVEFLKPGKKR